MFFIMGVMWLQKYLFMTHVKEGAESATHKQAVLPHRETLSVLTQT